MNYYSIDLEYIDDVAKMVTKQFNETDSRKTESLSKGRKGSCFRKHKSKFASTSSKFQLIHFRQSKKAERASENDTLPLKDHIIKSQNTETFLRVLLNKELRWFSHLRRVEKGVSQALNALNSLGGST